MYVLIKKLVGLYTISLDLMTYIISLWNKYLVIEWVSYHILYQSNDC